MQDKMSIGPSDMGTVRSSVLVRPREGPRAVARIEVRADSDDHLGSAMLARLGRLRGLFWRKLARVEQAI